MTHSDGLVTAALELAQRGHRGQWRSGSGLPYIDHPLDVVRRLASWGVARHVFPTVWAAALLHDVLEDTQITVQEIKNHCNLDVVKLVCDLTFRSRNADETVQSYRAAKDSYLHTFESKPIEALVIKVADRLCNVSDFLESDPRYARKYFGFARPLFESMHNRRAEIVAIFGEGVSDKIVMAHQEMASRFDPQSLVE